MDTLLQINDGLRMFRYAQKRRLFGFKKYSGSIKEISKKIINDAYNKKHNYFMVSSGHFRQFYARDFGMICQSLINLGYKNKVRSTLVYAMDKYYEAGKITTQISPKGIPFDFPYFTPESASYMLNSLLILNEKDLINKYASLFKKIADFTFNQAIDKKTGLLDNKGKFSSMKDHSARVSGCYDNCLLGLFAVNLKKAKISSELSKYKYSKIIKKYFWKKNHFIEDLSKRNIISGDANVFPFWTGLIKDKVMFKLAQQSIIKKGLDKPWPLKYTTKEDIPKKLHFADKLVYGYEHDTIWMHLGLCYLSVVHRYDKKLSNKYLKQYEDLIFKYKNFLELYESNGKPFRRMNYISDEGMIWVAIFLDFYNEKF